MTDEELVVQLKQGNKDAFDLLYDKYKNLAVRNAYLIIGNLSDAEDAVQEAFLISYFRINELKNHSGYKAWLMQILIRRTYRLAKKTKREFASDKVTEFHFDGIAGEAMPREDMTDQSSPLSKLITREEADRVMAAVNELPIKQRIVIVLYYYNDLGIEEIAAILHIRAGTVKSRLFTARNNLKQLLGDRESWQVLRGKA